MKKFITLLLFCFALLNLNAQTLIRWDFEAEGGSTLSPTFISHSSLQVNPVAYSNLFPVEGMSFFTTGVSGSILDRAARVRGWHTDTTGGNWLYDWIEFRFFVAGGYSVVIDSISFWYKRNETGPKSLHFRSYRDVYVGSLDTVSLEESNISWNKWSIPLNNFRVSGFEQVTFRIYAVRSLVSNIGTLTTDSVAIFGSSVPSQSLHLRTFLAGSFNQNTSSIRDDLRVQGLIPFSDPYELGKTTSSEVLQVSGDQSVIDWVLVEVRNPENPTSVLRSIPALLQKDGDIVGVDGVSPPVIDSLPGDYYVSVKHRNHLGVMTATPISLSDTIDFTLGETSVFGIDSRKKVGSSWCLWDGDVNGDGLIKYTGGNNDRDLVLQDIGGIVPTNTTGGYLDSDVNMDGVTKYTGSTNDRDIILSNIGGIIPTYVRSGSIP